MQGKGKLHCSEWDSGRKVLCDDEKWENDGKDVVKDAK